MRYIIQNLRFLVPVRQLVPHFCELISVQSRPAEKIKLYPFEPVPILIPCEAFQSAPLCRRTCIRQTATDMNRVLRSKWQIKKTPECLSPFLTCNLTCIFCVHRRTFSSKMLKNIKNPHKHQEYGIYGGSSLELMMGLEPAACSLRMSCSTN